MGVVNGEQSVARTSIGNLASNFVPEIIVRKHADEPFYGDVDRGSVPEIVVRKGRNVGLFDGVPDVDTDSESFIRANPLFASRGGRFDDWAPSSLESPETSPWRARGDESEAGQFKTETSLAGSELLVDEEAAFGSMNPDLWSLDYVVETDEPASSEDVSTRELVNLAVAIAPAVVTLRAWDEFGAELASSSGFFVREDGLVLTVMQLVHPEICGRIDYITATTGDGGKYLVTGVWERDVVTGFTLLETDARGVATVHLSEETDFDSEQWAAVLAVHATRGLIIADATVRRDTTIVGSGELVVSGEDSAGSVGSPLLTREGKVMGMVTMSTPLEEWTNFALPVSGWAERIELLDGAAKPVSSLPGGSLSKEIANDRRFIDAFTDLRDGKKKRAAIALLRLSRQYPRSAECWTLLGIAWRHLGENEEAAQCQKRAVALDPSLSEAWYQLAVSHSAIDGELGETVSREALEKTVMERPWDQLAWLLLGHEYVKVEDFEQAEAAVRQAIKINRRSAQGFYLLGFVRGKQGDLAGAEAAMLRCVDLRPKHVDAWFYLGLLYTNQEDPERAAEAFEEVVSLSPYHPHAWLNLAYAYRDSGKGTEARNAFSRRLEVEEYLRGT
ncbi:MAG: tetratricopeptide repeat-containing serine protease family protein [Verrucomicrobiota bacterium]